MVRYRNTTSGDVSTYASPIPLLEKSDRWERLDEDRPADSAPKSEWVDYAGTLGVDVDGLTKDEIIAAVG